ncbi:hypothetical protein ACLOJK_018129 [Asimina triloba]
MASPPLTQQPPPPLPLPPKHAASSPTHVSFKRPQQPPDDEARPVVAWTSSIASYCRSGRLSQAASTLTHMRLAGVDPNYITFAILLSACADFPSEGFGFGRSVHAQVRKLGLDRTNVVSGTALVGMYAKCARMESARRAFDEIEEKNSFSWNTMIDGYMRNGDVEAAVSLFHSMPSRDKVSWTAMIGGFVRNGHFEEALECFREMQRAGIERDYVTVIAVITACADLGALGQGMWMHRYVLKEQDFRENLRVRNSLIDMYARCGSIEFARQVFGKMPKRNVVSWNSIVVGYAINGHAEDALEHFSLLRKAGFEPDGVSFTGALTACSHAGLVDEGLRYYDEMKASGIAPRLEHYGCLVDLLSRAGRLEEALHVIQGMPIKPNEVVVGSLLAACRTHGEVGLAERLMDYLVELEPETDSNYVLLSNIYAALGKWDGVSKVRNKMKMLGIRKKPGFSAVEIDCNVHEFVAGDKSHVQSADIYGVLELLSVEMKRYGYVPESIGGAPAVHD